MAFLWCAADALGICGTVLHLRLLCCCRLSRSHVRLLEQQKSTFNVLSFILDSLMPYFGSTRSVE